MLYDDFFMLFLLPALSQVVILAPSSELGIYTGTHTAKKLVTD